jgi:class III poly(R)-hydroxyalkanoic acid synthase PhaE subunit
MLDAPALGLTREHQQRWQRTADAARRVAEAQRRLQCLWSDALRDAATAFAARVAASGIVIPSIGAPSVATLRSLYDSWIDCAEEAYAGTAHSDSFCNALADFVNASSQWRREFAASVEQWSKLMDLPTRSELNSLTLRLKSAEEQLRAERQQHELRDAASKPRPTPRASRTRRAKRNPKS